MNKELLLTPLILLAAWILSLAHPDDDFRSAASGHHPTELPALRHPALVDKFYTRRHQQLFWLAPGDDAAKGRRQLRSAIDSAAWRGLDSNRYHPDWLRNSATLPGAALPDAALPDAGPSGAAPSGATLSDSARMNLDRQYTDIALSLAFDTWRGDGIASQFSYDGVSPKFQQPDDDHLLSSLAALNPGNFSSWLDSLEPATAGFAALKSTLANTLESTDRSAATRITASLDLFRLIHHFHFPRFIIVNIPSATLRYYQADTVTLHMRVVAGQPGKRTPRFAAWCSGLVLYPYWNIPRRIAIHELLPLLKHTPSITNLMQYEILDQQGHRLDPGKIDWKALTPANFPYTLRQAPGCENALGVLKFELSDPFDVYMHDTNFKRAFGFSSRYLSHGCIRLEKAAQLGNLLLDHHLDTTVLSSCLKDQKPVSIPLTSPVPVFVAYCTALPDSTGKIALYKDIYHLMH